MLEFLAKTTLILLTVLVTGIGSDRAQAQTEPDKAIEQIQQYSEQGGENSVDRLRDVSPSDWSYEALRSLTERYNCISGLPDGTFPGERPITRNEFAAGLNSCLQQLERSLDSRRPDLMSVFYGNTRVFTEEDGSVATITAEGYMFESELATVGGRTDELESRTIQIENNQFSPTTKLTGETVFSFTDAKDF